MFTLLFLFLLPWLCSISAKQLSPPFQFSSRNGEQQPLPSRHRHRLLSPVSPPSTRRRCHWWAPSSAASAPAGSCFCGPHTCLPRARRKAKAHTLCSSWLHSHPLLPLLLNQSHLPWGRNERWAAGPGQRSNSRKRHNSSRPAACYFTITVRWFSHRLCTTLGALTTPIPFLCRETSCFASIEAKTVGDGVTLSREEKWLREGKGHLVIQQTQTQIQESVPISLVGLVTTSMSFCFSWI